MGRGKSSRHKPPASRQEQVHTLQRSTSSIAREPFSPYVSDGTRYAGLETDGMKVFKCSLLLPKDRKVSAEVKRIPPQTVSLYQDPVLHSSKDRKVDFPGATVLQLEVGDRSQLPEILTVAGKCRFTNECLNEFGIMMRTNAEARRQGIPTNGAYDWPDVRCLLLCPVCENMAQPDNDYWMLFYPLLQLIPPVTFGMRTAQRLTCGSCMESLLQGISCKSHSSGEPRTMMEILEELPNASFLDGPNNPIISKMTSTDLSAWDLFTLWNNSGAWEANENVRKELMQDILGAWEPNPDTPRGQVRMDIDSGGTKNDSKKKADSTCRTCSKEMLPDDVMRCSRCKKAACCRRECQQKDWPGHKL